MLNIQKLNSDDLSPMRVLGVVVLVSAYWAAINYRIPFTTLDDIILVAKPWPELMSEAFANDRPSHLIYAALSYLLSFSVPDFISLTPRFITAIALFFSLIALLRNLRFSLLSSAQLAGFALITHEVDWQHNGLISYFGVYNILLSCFIVALITDLSDQKGIIRYFLIALLFELSFASELFVGLSIIYLFLLLLAERSGRRVITSPAFLAVIVYVMMSWSVLSAASSERAQFMQNYLMGGFDHGMDSIAKAALLYVAYSIPHLSALHLSVFGGCMLGLALVLISMLWAGNCMVLLYQKTAQDGRPGIDDSSRFCILMVSVALIGVLPELLISLQPNKMGWILGGSSHRYIFSLYTWIACVILVGWALKITLPGVTQSRYFQSLCMIGVIASAVYNFNFTEDYNRSREKWLAIDALADGPSESPEIEVPVELTENPYIVSVSPSLFRKYIRRNYDKYAKLCVGDQYRSLYRHPAIEMKGFNGEEVGGLWTRGLATLTLHQNLLKGDVVQLLFSDSFSLNMNNPTTLKLGGVTSQAIIKPGDVVELIADQPYVEPDIVISPFSSDSPKSLGLSEDVRSLGVKMKAIRIFRKNGEHDRKDLMLGCF